MIHHGDCLTVMAGMEAESVDAICTDPPYGLEFMGKEWDRLDGIGQVSTWGIWPGQRGRPTRMPSANANVRCRNCNGWKVGRATNKSECNCERPDYPDLGNVAGAAMQGWHARWAEAAYRVAKPSAYLLAFGGTRTVHRMTVALEDAGWIIRDMLVWAYASGFPKSKASLKPAWEPIVMARKPGPLRELAIDACRIAAPENDGVTWTRGGKQQGASLRTNTSGVNEYVEANPLGRWPANVILTDELFESGVPGVVIAGSLTGTMTAWSSSPDSEPSPTVSPVRRAAPKSSRGVPGVSFPASATGPAVTQLDAWGTSTDTPKPDTGCFDGTTADGAFTSGSTGKSGRTPTGRSQPATSSITATATGSTTDSTTSNSSPEPSTTGTTKPSRPESSRLGEPREPGTSDGSNDESANSRLNSSRAGEPSADRRYTDHGGTDFAPLPGERRDVDGFGYSRFFLIPKADRSDREPVLGGLATAVVSVWGGDEDDLTPGKKSTVARQNVHPTVKPVDLMRHLVRLVTPPGGTVLDPFLGSGTTGLAAEMEGFPWIGIEREAEYVAIAEARLNGTQKGMGLVG